MEEPSGRRIPMMRFGPVKYTPPDWSVFPLPKIPAVDDSGIIAKIAEEHSLLNVVERLLEV
jgi:hypothetical protein